MTALPQHTARRSAKRIFCLAYAAVDINCGNYSLKCVRHNRRPCSAARHLLTLTEQEPVAEVYFLGILKSDFRTRRMSVGASARPRENFCGAKKILRRYKAENRVAQKLKSLIVARSKMLFVCIRRMCDRSFQKRYIFKSILYFSCNSLSPLSILKSFHSHSPRLLRYSSRSLMPLSAIAV